MSEITERLWAEYEAFSKRDLSEHAIVYLFVDGIAERLRPGQQREAVLAAWGIGDDGRKVLLALMAGSKEDVETVRAFFQDLRARGLGDPLLVVSDGAPGIIRAIEECFPRSARQRCLAHRMRNLAIKVPTDLWPEFKARVTACYQAPSRAIARAAGDAASAPTTPWSLPSALACFEDDFEACVAHLRLPVTHRRLTRTTNLLERLFVEERRRLKIIPNGFGEKPVFKLMFGALIRAAERWRGLRFTEFELRQLAAPQGTRPGISGFNHAAGTVIPAPCFQQIHALTISAVGEHRRARSGCCLPALALRTKTPPTHCISLASPRRIR